MSNEMNENNAPVEQAQEQQTTRQRQPDLQDAALALRELFGAGLAYDERHDAWMRWTGTHWQDSGQSKTELDRAAMEACRSVGVQISNAGKLDGTLRLAKAGMRREFHERENIVTFTNGSISIERSVDENGVVRWSLGQLREHRAEDDQTRCMPYPIELHGAHPAISAFLGQAVPDPLARECLIAHIGLALVRDTAMHYSVILHGPPRSGKSTLMAITRLVCGAHNKAEATDWCPANVFDDDLEAKRTRYMRRNEPIACVDEVPSAALRGEEIFKMMSAHGGVPMRGIGRDDAIDTTWQAKIVMATNSTPSFKDASGAIAERLIPIFVPNHRREHERDQALLDKLVEELPSFAATCIRAALDVRNRGFYRRSRAQMATLAAWARVGNPLRAFLDEHCELDPSGRILVNELFEKYKEALAENDQRNLQQANFSAELGDMSLGVERKKVRASKAFRSVARGSVAWHFTGIRLKVASEYTDADDSSDGDQHDYRPAIENDIELGERANALIAEGRYAAAYAEVLRMQNNEDRQFAIDTMANRGLLRIGREGKEQAELFELSVAA